MRERPSSRLLIVDREKRILLFRFEHRKGPYAGAVFWATPGGGLDPGESFENCARRELLEETGLSIADPGPQIHRRLTDFELPDGETISVDERYFLLRVDTLDVSQAGWTELEREIMGEHRWWSASELRSAAEQVWPDDLCDLMERAGVWPG